MALSDSATRPTWRWQRHRAGGGGPAGRGAGARPRRHPGAAPIDAVAGQLGVPAGAAVKAMPVVVEGAAILALVRGDHRLNEISSRTPSALRSGQPRRRRCGASSGRSRVHRPGRGAPMPVLADEALRGRAAWSPAATARRAPHRGRAGAGLRAEWADIRQVEPGTAARKELIRVEPAIEVGNIFKLGTRYSEPLGARYLDEQGERSS